MGEKEIADHVEIETDDTVDEFSSRTHIGPSYTHDVDARLPIEEGNFRLRLFRDRNEKEHLALVKGDVKDKEDVLCRVHSECLTGDLLGSLRCDCGPQLRESIRRISEEGEGVLIYLRQEGRGIGLVSKLKAYNLQDQGYDTVDANLLLGHKAEERDYGIAEFILRELGAQSIKLLSNNPDKINKLKRRGVVITERLPMHPRVNGENLRYLKTKVERMEHRIDIGTLSPNAPEREEVKRYVRRKISGNNPISVTLYMVQGLDGRTPVKGPAPYTRDEEEEHLLRKQLRDLHDAFLVDVESIKQNNMDLESNNSAPFIMDPVPSNEGDGSSIRIVRDDLDEDTGEDTIRVPFDMGRPDPDLLLKKIVKRGIDSIMVEGPPRFLSELLRKRRADVLVSTIVPYFFDDGTCAMEGLSDNPTGHIVSMNELNFKRIGEHMVYFGSPEWNGPR